MVKVNRKRTFNPKINYTTTANKHYERHIRMKANEYNKLYSKSATMVTGNISSSQLLRPT